MSRPTDGQAMMSGKAWMWLGPQALIVAFAFAFVWVVGHRGLMIMDQSVLFDSAWRLYQGQMIYRDYVIPRPPVAILIQWLSFHLFGVNFSAMVVPAAILNALAAACVIWMVRRIFPTQRLVACAAGLLTAVWFQAPFGTLWFEQTAFFFDLLGLALLLQSARQRSTKALLLRCGAGFVLALAILSKQNAGVEFIPVAIGAVVILNRARLRAAFVESLQIFAGAATAAVILIVWLWNSSSLAGFWYCCVELARTIASDRIHFLPTVLYFLILSLAPTSLTVLTIQVLAVWKQRASHVLIRNSPLVTWIVFGCVSFQNLFQTHTANELANSFPFLGLTLGLSVGLLIEAVSGTAESPGSASGQRHPLVPYVLFCVFIFGLEVSRGVTASWRREVQQFGSTTQFVPLNVQRAERLQWGEPTPVGSDSEDHLSSVIRAEDFTALNEWLAATNTNFFVFPDSTILYGLQQRISPQPWVFLLPDHTFHRSELPQVDETVVASLRKNRVGVIVIERDTFLGTHKILADMPRLRGFIKDDFEKVRQFGIYEAWQLKR